MISINNRMIKGWKVTKNKAQNTTFCVTDHKVLTFVQKNRI